MVRIYAGTDRDTSVSTIIQSSTPKAIPYRNVATIPMKMEPERREQQRQDVRNAIVSTNTECLISPGLHKSMPSLHFLYHRLFR